VQDITMIPSQFHWQQLACLLALMAVLGCGGQPAGKETAESSGQKKPGGGKKSSKKGDAQVTHEDGKKFIDGIPYDVWFDDPLAVAANSAAVTPSDTGSPAPETVAKTDTPAKTEEKPDAAAAGGDWSAYIATEQLQEEAKRVRNQLKGLLLTQKEYGENFEVIKMDGAVISALAGIVAESGDGVNWKANAPLIRDYGFDIFESAKGLGKPNYDKTNAAYENLQSVFSGSIPAGAPESEPKRPFADVASRYYLMKRMKLAFEALKLNINTEGKLKSDQEQALHEVMVLGTLTKVVTLDGYSSSDEAEYQGFTQGIVQQSREALQAVKDQDFPKFQDALNKIDKSCLECHVQYKGN
jgi:hypothetical protein